MQDDDEVAAKVDQLLGYSLSIAREFEARLNRLRTFVKHNLSSGTANEAILRDFLSAHAPGNIEVGQGFICDPMTGTASKQCDILIHDRGSFPLVYSDGPIRVVWPRAARMVIEVKTKFGKGDIKAALENIRSGLSFNVYHTEGFVFAFESPRLETVLQHLRSFGSDLGEREWPTAVFLLDKGVIIHRKGYTRMRNAEAHGVKDPFSFYVQRARREKGAVVVACLLLSFFETLDFDIYKSEMMNLLMELFDRHTDAVE